MLLFVFRASAAAISAAFVSAPIQSMAQSEPTNQSEPTRVAELNPVEVRSGRPTSVPLNIPTTSEGITAKTIATTINATDSSDALKYFPSLLVRKRYIGDFDHAVLATRASGTGNSARSLVYADGILLSNLLGNGASFTPRWGLVTPEEIERVDVLYGPFSASYSGNSVGAVVDYLTRMPTQFEAHAKVGFFSQGFSQYGSSARYSGNQFSGSLGSASGPWSWFVNASRQSSDGQPLVFANRLISQGTVSTSGTPVSGAVLGQDPRNRDWLLLGSSSQISTVQDHLKAKVAYEFSPTMKLSYTAGTWQNDARRYAQTYLRDGAGNPVYSGNVNISTNGVARQYSLVPGDFANALNGLNHYMHGASLKTNTKGFFDWEIAASQYVYGKDEVRAPLLALPASRVGGAGRITDLQGSGWNTLAIRGTLRPSGSASSPHVIDFGVQRDAFKLRSLVSDTSDWINGAPAARFSAFTGNTLLTSAYVQDTWRIQPGLRASLGLRYETWQASNGSVASAATSLALSPRQESHLSPKAAIAYELSNEITLKASAGRAVRFPTVSELYQGSVSGTVVINNDPNLRPERSVTNEISGEYAINNGLLRATLFRESTHDALYSQTNVTVVPNVTNIQNIDLVRTLGFELAAQQNDLGFKGLNVAASATYTDSKIVANAKFPASIGKWQPRVPSWHAK